MKNFKITTSTHGTVLYPTPVDKERTYLITAENLREARLLKHLLDPGYLRDPWEWPEVYRDVGVHADNRTPRYQLMWEKLRLEYLPERGLDFTRAEILEGIMARKIARLVNPADTSAMEDLYFRLNTQKACSECDKLGINAPVLQVWFDGFRNLF